MLKQRIQGAFAAAGVGAALTLSGCSAPSPLSDSDKALKEQCTAQGYMVEKNSNAPRMRIVRVQNPAEIQKIRKQQKKCDALVLRINKANNPSITDILKQSPPAGVVAGLVAAGAALMWDRGRILRRTDPMRTPSRKPRSR